MGVLSRLLLLHLTRYACSLDSGWLCGLRKLHRVSRYHAGTSRYCESIGSGRVFDQYSGCGGMCCCSLPSHVCQLPHCPLAFTLVFATPQDDVLLSPTSKKRGLSSLFRMDSAQSKVKPAKKPKDATTTVESIVTKPRVTAPQMSKVCFNCQTTSTPLWRYDWNDLQCG
jgi:hypothetical protein